jgi:hypothetical protein
MHLFRLQFGSTVRAQTQTRAWIRVIATAFMLASLAMTPAQADYQISPPIEKGKVPNAVPMQKDEARAKEEAERLPLTTIYVEGRSDPDRRLPPPKTVEERFADALNAGNPEVAGGWIRHGSYYDGLFYWGNDPFTFIYLNVKNRLAD